MVTISVHQEDLEELIQAKLPRDLSALNEILGQIKCEASRAISEESGVEELSLENKEIGRAHV